MLTSMVIAPETPRFAWSIFSSETVLKPFPCLDQEVQTAVQQTPALEGGYLCNAIDGLERRVDLKLIGRNLLVT